FGFMGFVIGPIIAALFVTLWELYGDEFKDWLPTTAFKPQGEPIELPHQRLGRERESNGSEQERPEEERPDTGKADVVKERDAD
ncbi:MAG: hypothetical protein AB8B63_18965, partial [Granulosicoccus sp.]